MAKGYSLHIGVRQVNLSAEAYIDEANLIPIHTAMNDVSAMVSIAMDFGYHPINILVNKQATIENFKKECLIAAHELEAGDIFLLTFSGHGGQLHDENMDEGEKDDTDETLALYDGHLIDDLIFEMFCKFEKGVRILFLPDSCFSGGVDEFVGTPLVYIPFSFHKKQKEKETLETGLKATLLMISATTEEKTANQGDKYSDFTNAIYYMWQQGALGKNYNDFFYQLRDYDHSVQEQLGLIKNDYQDFINQSPFTI